jgi:hypothetical protein
MYIPESVFRSEAFPAPATPVFVAEIACIMCTVVVGTAIDTHWPPVRGEYGAFDHAGKRLALLASFRDDLDVFVLCALPEPSKS